MSAKTKKRDKFSPLTITMLVLLIVYCVLMLSMLFWGVMQSLKGTNHYEKNPASIPIKFKDITFFNYAFVYAFANSNWMGLSQGSPGFLEILLNTCLYAIGGAFLNVTITALIAYLSARYHYFYSKILYTIVIIVMVTPIVGAQASEIQVLRQIRLYDTRFAFVVLKASFVAGVYFLVFHAAFEGIPATYSEAAMMDGAGNWCIMLKICLPLVANVFMTVFLITFIQYWNDYQLAMVYMPSYPTLSYFIFSFQGATFSANEFMDWMKYPYLENFYNDGNEFDPEYPTVQLAAASILVIPITIIFLSMHKRLMGNLSVGGIKG